MCPKYNKHYVIPSSKLCKQIYRHHLAQHLGWLNGKGKDASTSDVSSPVVPVAKSSSRRKGKGKGKGKGKATSTPPVVVESSASFCLPKTMPGKVAWQPPSEAEQVRGFGLFWNSTSSVGRAQRSGFASGSNVSVAEHHALFEPRQ